MPASLSRDLSVRAIGQLRDIKVRTTAEVALKAKEQCQIEARTERAKLLADFERGLVEQQAGLLFAEPAGEHGLPTDRRVWAHFLK